MIWVLLTLAGIAAGFAFRAMRADRRLREQHAELREQHTKLLAAADEMLRVIQGHEELNAKLKAKVEGAASDELATCKARIVELTAEVVEAEAKTLRYFDKIDGACKQRDGWFENYENSRVMFMGTQEAMLAEIERLSRLCRQEPKPIFQRMVQGFREQFPKPAGPESLPSARIA